jgi:2-polyprenyl-6-methoxyphenol hydroxylase-like FAD-dependent oxidoreductase
MTSSIRKKTLEIGIVGLGTAGLASGIFLSRLGHTVKIYEKTSKDQLNQTVGAGIGIQPIGLTVLKKLGVLNNVLNHGSKISHLQSLTREGKTVLDLKYQDFRPELFGVGLHRDSLFQALYNKCLKEDHITIIPSTNITTISKNNHGSGSYICYDTDSSKEKQEKQEGPFDMVIVADGRNSIRANMKHVKSYESKYQFGCLWSILPDVNELFSKKDSNGGAKLFQRLDSSNIMLGLLPTGRTPSMSKDDSTLISLFWSIDMNTIDQVKKNGLESWKETVLTLEPRTKGLLSSITHFDQLIPAGYSDTFMPKLYDDFTNTAFIGDSAHATSPQLGQGANLALVDAWVLSKAIDEQNGNVLKALHQYDQERKWRLRFYQLNSRLLTPVFQSNSKMIGALRDLTMGPILCRFPPTKLQMLTVLCGAQNNGIPWTTIPEEEFMGFLTDENV